MTRTATHEPRYARFLRLWQGLSRRGATGTGWKVTGVAQRPIRVLAWPKAARENAYFALIYGSLAAHGIEVFQHRWMGLAVGRVDVWHVHFPERALGSTTLWKNLLRVGFFCTAVTYAKARGVKIVWTVHNLHPHEQKTPWLERALYHYFTRRTDLFISLSDFGVKAAKTTHPNLRVKPYAVIRHPHYATLYRGCSKAEARLRLGLGAEQKVLLHFGLIRPYKNVPCLIHRFRAAAIDHAMLVIAGRPMTGEIRREIIAAADGDPRVRLDLRFISDPEIPIYIRSADAIVLPYADILNSGAAMLGVALGRPVLSVRKGAMPELESILGRDWVWLIEGELTVADLRQCVSWSTASDRPATVDLAQFSPAAAAEGHAAAFRHLISGSSEIRGGEGGTAEPAASHNGG